MHENHTILKLRSIITDWAIALIFLKTTFFKKYTENSLYQLLNKYACLYNYILILVYDIYDLAIGVVFTINDFNCESLMYNKRAILNIIFYT